jgi:hypothetical protein
MMRCWKILLLLLELEILRIGFQKTIRCFIADIFSLEKMEDNMLYTHSFLGFAGSHAVYLR